MEYKKDNYKLNWILSKYNLKNINELIDFTDNIAQENENFKKTINIRKTNYI